MSTLPSGPLAAAVTLLALVPVVAYAVGTGAPSVALSAVCVVLIAGILYYAFAPGRSGAAPAEQ